MKNTWLKCRQCECKIHRKTHQGGQYCVQCAKKLDKKKVKENVKN